MENKTSKYFKYAIAEVFLVVIGILIALQINNWNEENKLDKTRVLKLQLIEADLISDIKDLSNLYNQQQQSTNSQQDHWIIYL